MESEAGGARGRRRTVVWESRRDKWRESDSRGHLLPRPRQERKNHIEEVRHSQHDAHGEALRCGGQSFRASCPDLHASFPRAEKGGESILIDPIRQLKSKFSLLTGSRLEAGAETRESKIECVNSEGCQTATVLSGRTAESKVPVPLTLSTVPPFSLIELINANCPAQASVHSIGKSSRRWRAMLPRVLACLSFKASPSAARCRARPFATQSDFTKKFW